MDKFLAHYIAHLRVEEKPLDVPDRPGEPAGFIPNWELAGEAIEIHLQAYAAILYGKSGKVFIQTHAGIEEIAEYSFYQILQLLEDQLADLSIPFFGLMAYELNHQSLNIPAGKIFYDLPDFYILLPGCGQILNQKSDSITDFYFEDSFIPENPETRNVDGAGQLLFSEEKPDYYKKIETIKELIREGEVYQANYTTRFSKKIAASGFDFFQALYNENPAPFSFYFKLPHCEIISNSPERFLSLNGETVSTEPIKGTIHRSDDPLADLRLRRFLLKSEKDGAELSMIVDLLRNDISRVCAAGSVNVTAHKTLHSFRNVHHLISTIEGKLKKGRNYIDLLQNTFPGGSITGCPKIAAMKFIAELELHERSFYTGSFFIRNVKQNILDASILIRTAIMKQGQIHFQAGGGIVIDSMPESEYNECLAKAASFLKVINRG